MMVSYLKGRLEEKYSNAVVIDCGGVGYWINVPATVPPALPETGKDVGLYIIMLKSKTDLSLYGFLDEVQRTYFQLLNSVSGCGATNSLSVLGSLTPMQIYRAVSEKDAIPFSTVKGIGKKLSQRIVMELSEKVTFVSQADMPVAESIVADASKTAIEALISLGYKKKEAERVVNQLDGSLPVEQLISKALKKLV